MDSLIKVLTLAGFLFGMPAGVLSQALTDEVVPLGKKGDYMSGHIASFAANDTLYFMQVYPERRGNYLSFVKDGNIDSAQIVSDKKSAKLTKSRVLAFAIVKSQLVILSDENIFQFALKGGKWKYKGAIRNNDGFTVMQPLGDQLFLEVCYPFYRSVHTRNSLWAMYDPMKMQLTKEIVPPVDNSRFGNFVHSWTSAAEGVLAHASTWDYNIRFYNSSLEAIDSLHGSSEFLTPVDPAKLEQFDNSSKDGIAQLMAYDDENFGRIRKIFLLDPSHLAVLIKPASKTAPGKLAVDLWSKSADGWVRDQTLLADQFNAEGNPYDKTSFALGGLYQNMQSLVVSGGAVQRIFCPYYPQPETDSFDRSRDVDGWLRKQNDLYYGLETFTFRFR
jgi:hypothetical protein